MCADFVRDHGQLMEGEVFTSLAGKLKCKKVVHAVGPRWKGGYSHEERALFTCIHSCFDEAKIQQFDSIAIPPISTGVFGFPPDKAVKTIVEAVGDRVARGEFLPSLIIFVDKKEVSLQLFEKELGARYEQTRPTPQTLLKQKSQDVSHHQSSLTGQLHMLNILFSQSILRVYSN